MRHSVLALIHLDGPGTRDGLRRVSGSAGGQSLRRLSYRLSVLVLVSCKSCFSLQYQYCLICRKKVALPGECLLAVWIRALVWPLARVYPAMASKRAGIAKGLSTSLAHVRLLTSVDTEMDCQGRALDELLLAASILTDMRADARMYTFYLNVSMFQNHLFQYNIP